MAAWHRSRKADLGLRLLGLVLCAIAYGSISQLIVVRAAHVGEDPDIFCFALAALGFLAASAGGALTCHGHHLFDEIEVPARWRRRGLEVTPISDISQTQER